MTTAYISSAALVVSVCPAGPQCGCIGCSLARILLSQGLVGGVLSKATQSCHRSCQASIRLVMASGSLTDQVPALAMSAAAASRSSSQFVQLNAVEVIPA